MLTLLAVVTFNPHYPMCEDIPAAIETVDTLRYEGRLDRAIREVDMTFACEELTTPDKVTLHLRLATIHDRKGLHHNTRPVRAALQEIMTAQSLAAENDLPSQAAIKLALARYYYRAEMAERKFTLAEDYATDASKRFAALGDSRGEADAAHLLGLVHFQRGQMEHAEYYFGESLRLEGKAARDNPGSGARPELMSDFARHMAFVYDATGQPQQALEYYRDALRIRRDGGLVDASMFAAVSYANALIEADRADEAGEFIADALRIADRINSPVGEMRALATRAKEREALGDPAAAVADYAAVRALAETVASESYRDWADAAIARLTPE